MEFELNALDTKRHACISRRRGWCVKLVSKFYCVFHIYWWILFSVVLLHKFSECDKIDDTCAWLCSLLLYLYSALLNCCRHIQKQETGIGWIKIVRNISQLILFNMSSKRLLVFNTFMTIYISTNISSNKCYSYGNMKSD